MRSIEGVPGRGCEKGGVVCISWRRGHKDGPETKPLNNLEQETLH